MEIEDLKRINVQPGDIFVARIPSPCSPEDAAAIRARWHAAVGPDVPLVIIAAHIELAVYRPVEGS